MKIREMKNLVQKLTKKKKLTIKVKRKLSLHLTMLMAMKMMPTVTRINDLTKYLNMIIWQV